MKSLQQIKDDHAQDRGFENWDDFMQVADSHGLSPDEIGYDEVSEKYAAQFKPKIK